jgi:hypothetical protein
MARRLTLGLALGAALIALTAPAAQAADELTPTQKQAISAFTRFTVVYAGLIWETRCNTMPAAQHEAFKRQVAGQRARLNSIFDARMMDAATGSAQTTAGGPELAACDGKNAGMAKSFLDMAADVDGKLANIPEGFQVRVGP